MLSLLKVKEFHWVCLQILNYLLSYYRIFIGFSKDNSSIRVYFVWLPVDCYVVLYLVAMCYCYYAYSSSRHNHTPTGQLINNTTGQPELFVAVSFHHMLSMMSIISDCGTPSSSTAGGSTFGNLIFFLATNFC